MSCYHHLTINERESLMLFFIQGMSMREIARKMNRSVSTISRELRRTNNEYRASCAQNDYEQRRKRSVRHCRLENLELRRLVQFSLSHMYWSPEQISKRLTMEGMPISTSTIYRALDNGLLRDTLRYYLRFKYKTLGKASKRNKSCFSKSIHMRPKEADMRIVDGHWEGDTVRGHRESECIVTLVDRHSRFLLADVVPNRESTPVRETICRLLKESKLPVKTITFDRGTEFAEGSQMEIELNADVYFARPSAPWQRPTNENTNGLLRQFIPKRSKISDIAQDTFRRYIFLLNFRPRKCLGWKTPYEVAFHQVLHFT